MSTDTIKEFLVGLGFKIDESSQRKFISVVEGISKSMAALGVAVEGAAIGVVAAIDKISRGFEDLYFISQRSGASVANIKAMANGVRKRLMCLPRMESTAQ